MLFGNLPKKKDILVGGIIVLVAFNAIAVGELIITI
jgi:hypothetical protein